jgi:hypothetical protein
VDALSSAISEPGHTAANKQLLELPVKKSFKASVSFEA